MQTYDQKGTTRVQYTFIERGKKKREWCVLFTQGHIKISDVFGTTNLRVNFPETDHWAYEDREPSVRNGAIEHGAQIKTKHFTLIVDLRTYLTPDDPEFDPDYHEAGVPEGFIVLETTVSNLTLSIPYGLATSLITLMSGSTALAGVVGLMKS
jgi:hypothetical protein